MLLFFNINVLNCDIIPILPTPVCLCFHRVFKPHASILLLFRDLTLSLRIFIAKLPYLTLLIDGWIPIDKNDTFQACFVTCFSVTSRRLSTWSTSFIIVNRYARVSLRWIFRTCSCDNSFLNVTRHPLSHFILLVCSYYTNIRRYFVRIHRSI